MKDTLRLQKKGFPVGVIEMIVVEGLTTILIIILAIKLWSCETRLDLINEEVEDFIAETRELKQRCEGHKELIEALSKSVRKLNGVVEEAVKDKEQTSDNKPDAKALIGGWTTDDVRTGNDASCIGIGLIDGQTLVIPVRDTGRVLMNHGKAVANHWHGRLWTDDEGRIYEMPEGCFILGDTPYEMDQ